uniref:Uncharacterized protein n=1 Tax=Wolbachia endosymbiont of Aleurodicus floccissimus TaxID=2152762 RepID=A0A3B0IXT8_9RICK
MGGVMSNIVNQELVKAVSTNLYGNGIVLTNFNIEEKETGFLWKQKKDYIVISFDRNMSTDQCWDYLSSMKGKIAKKFCGGESAIDLSFDKEFFPFNLNKGKLKAYEGKYRYSVPIEEGVVFNLKCLLANGLAVDVTGAMGGKFGVKYAGQYISHEKFDGELYLYCMHFRNEVLRDYFIENFLSKVKGYKNSPDDFLEIEGDSVYIKKGIFDNLEFIKEIQRDDACSITYDFQDTELQDAKSFKDTMIDLINRKSGVLICATHLTPSGLIVPMTQDGRESLRILKKSEADKINTAFNMKMLSAAEEDDLSEEVLVDGGTYTIDFSNPEISFSIVDEAMQNSLINKDYGLSIDPARVQAPKTEMDRDETSRDSGLGDSPQKASTSFKRSSMKRQSPKRKLFDGDNDVLDAIRRTSLTASQRRELRRLLSPELQKKLDCGALKKDECHLYLTYTSGGKRELNKSFESKESQVSRLAEAQLTVSPKLSGEDSGISSTSSSGLRSSLTHKDPRPELEKCCVRCLDNERAFE